MTEPVVTTGAVMAVSMGADSLVRLHWAAGVTVTGELARDAVAAVGQVCGGRSCPLLVDMTATAGLTREARGVFGQPSAASSIALLGSSAVDRVIANFILGVTSVPVPTKFFTEETEAVAWLNDVSDDRT